jgi:uncharacterized RDD family membrane protein YckC
MTQEMNPYRPPTAEVELIPEAGEGRPLATKWRRVCTLLLDYIGFYLLGALVGIVLFALLGQRAHAFYASGWSTLMSLFLVLGYYLFFEGLWSRTPGKMILGTLVVDMKGGTPTFGSVVKRSLARFVPFEAFTFFGEQGFHDKVSRTRVVRTR